MSTTFVQSTFSTRFHIILTFIGFIGFNYLHKDGFLSLEKEIPIVEKKISALDKTIEELDPSFLQGNKEFKRLANIIIEIKDYYHNLKTAIVFYGLNKTILSLFAVLSFYIMVPIFTIENIFFFEFIISLLLFLEFSLLPKERTNMNISWYFIVFLLNIFFYLLLFFFLYPHFCITSLRFILFFSYFFQQGLGIYHFLLAPYKRIRKNKYLNHFSFYFLFLFLFMYKTYFAPFSVFGFLFIVFINISFFLLIEIIKNAKK